MIDIGANIKEKLLSVHENVYYAYPTKWVHLPVISFYELDNSEYAHGDDEEISSSITFSIDIWAKTPEETHQLGDKINAVMQRMQGTREGAHDLFETETGFHHRNLQFNFKKEA